MTTYLTLPVLEVEPHRGGDWGEDMERVLEIAGSPYGAHKGFSPTTVPRVARSFDFVLTSPAKIAVLRNFIGGTAIGRLKPFWMPTWHQDFALTVDPQAGHTQLTVKSVGYAGRLYPLGQWRSFLAILRPNGSHIYRKVVLPTDNGVTETLTLDAPIGVSFAKDDCMVSFLTLCRLASDRNDFQWRSNTLATIALPVLELVAEMNEAPLLVIGNQGAGDSVLAAPQSSGSGQQKFVGSGSSSAAAGVGSAGTGILNAVIGSGSSLAGATASTGVGDTPGPGGSNEPPGYTLVQQQDFGFIGEDGWINNNNDVDLSLVGAGAINGEQTIPSGNPLAGCSTYRNGIAQGGGPIFYYSPGFQGLGFRKLYLRFWLQASTNFWGANVNKIMFIQVGNVAGQLVPAWVGTDAGPLTRMWRLQGCWDGSVGSFNLPSMGAATRGLWEKWETLLELNSATDTLDARFTTWINGVFKQSITGFRVVGDNCGQPFTTNFYGVKWNPTWGSSPTNHYDQTLNTIAQAPFQMYMDSLRYSGHT